MYMKRYRAGQGSNEQIGTGHAIAVGLADVKRIEVVGGYDTERVREVTNR